MYSVNVKVRGNLETIVDETFKMDNCDKDFFLFSPAHLCSAERPAAPRVYWGWQTHLWEPVCIPYHRPPGQELKSEADPRPPVLSTTQVIITRFNLWIQARSKKRWKNISVAWSNIFPTKVFHLCNTPVLREQEQWCACRCVRITFALYPPLPFPGGFEPCTVRLCFLL